MCVCGGGGGSGGGGGRSSCRLLVARLLYVPSLRQSSEQPPTASRFPYPGGTISNAIDWRLNLATLSYTPAPHPHLAQRGNMQSENAGCPCHVPCPWLSSDSSS
jgi:hypothetical protein